MRGGTSAAASSSSAAAAAAAAGVGAHPGSMRTVAVATHSTVVWLGFFSQVRRCKLTLSNPSYKRQELSA
jgi:hypothetical protein